MKARSASGTEPEAADGRKPKKYSTPLAHPSYSIEPCPNEECRFPEADGGHCPECGWTRYCGCPWCKSNNK